MAKHIAEEMRGSKGAVMYDGGTRRDTHYLGVFGLYVRDAQILRHGKLDVVQELSMPLLSASQIASVAGQDEDGNDVFREATTFDAESHIRQLEDVFNIFNINVHE